MSSLQVIIEVSSIINQAAETNISKQDYCDEIRKVAIRFGSDSNESQNDQVTPVLCPSEWDQDDERERNSMMMTQVQNVPSIPMKNLDYACLKPRWSKRPIVVAGGNGVGAELQQLHHPNDISLDMNGSIYVADYSNKRVVRWRTGSNTVGEIVAGGDIHASSPLSLTYPRRIHVTKDGTLFILDDNRVLQLSKDASQYTILSNTLGVPTSLFVDDRNNIYVSERANSRILKWTPGMPPQSQGVVVAGTGKQGSGSDEFSWPRAIFVDSYENLYAIDRDNARVQCWSKNAQRGTTVIKHTSARLFLGIHVDPNGNKYLLDWRNSQILKYSPDGNEEVVISDDGTHQILNSPTALKFDQYGNMLVNDKYNNRVVMFPLESGVFGY